MKAVIEKIKFYNFTQHKLLGDQQSYIKEKLGIEEVTELSEICPWLYKELSNTPGKVAMLKDLAHSMVAKILQLADNYFSVIHMPIGSPGFNYLLSQKLYKTKISLLQGYTQVKYGYLVIFSHMPRICEETHNPDGTVSKKYVLKFDKFIPIDFYASDEFYPEFKEWCDEIELKTGWNPVYDLK
ncbi:MAG: hypothetical protein KatS3mg083_294 [Candidatus Dojkabacteria bacterium]|nr:MAG: hypothetical protein KatS3mg083_294 [Candidatus Dojkabacteria bacterium]